MTYKLTFAFRGKEYTVTKTHEQVVAILSVDGVRKVSLELVSKEEPRKQWNRRTTRQKKMIEEKGITAKMLIEISGKSQRVIYSWLSKDDEKHYQMISDIVKQIEERR